MNNDDLGRIKRMFAEAMSSGNKIAKEAIDFQDAAHGVAGQLASLLISDPDGIHRIHSTPALAVRPLYDRLTLDGFRDAEGKPVKLCDDDRELIQLAIFYTFVSAQFYCAAASSVEPIFGARSQKEIMALRAERAYRLLDHSQLKTAPRKVAERLSDLATVWAKRAMTMTPGAHD